MVNRTRRVKGLGVLSSLVVMFAIPLTAAEAGKQDETSTVIAISEEIPFSVDTTRTGSPFSSATTQDEAAAKCDLGRTLSTSIVAGATRKGIEIVPTSEIAEEMATVLCSD